MSGRKPIGEIAAGDWVLGESLISSRIVGRPWQVSRISGKRLYLSSYRLSKDGNLELCDERQMHIKTVRMVFSDMDSATAVSDYARAESDEYERDVKRLFLQLKARVEEKAGAPIARASVGDSGETK
jgi:hypothetical protein